MALVPVAPCAHPVTPQRLQAPSPSGTMRGATVFVLALALTWVPVIGAAQALQPAPHVLERRALEAAVVQAATSAPADVELITISQAVAEATDRNLDLIAERFNVPIAQARVLTARLRPNPIFSFEAGHLIYPITPTFNKDNSGGPNEFAWRTDFVWERGGKRDRRIETAEASRSVAEFQLLDAVRTLTLSVQTAFVDILEAKANLALALDTLKTFEDIVHVNTVRVRNGDLAEVELIRTQVAQVQFENTVRQAQLQVQTARARLQLLLGRGIRDRAVDASGEMRRDEVPADLPALTQQASAQRPDLLAQRRDQARSQAELRLQLAEGTVDYTIGAEYRRQQGASAYANLLGFFFASNLPFFNRNQGEIARATQEQLQVQTKLRSLEAAVQSDVNIALLRYSNAQTTLSRVEGALVDRARDVRQITEYSYRRGEASFLEFLDAQRAYNETMQAYNGARAEFARSRYGIDAAIGGAAAASSTAAGTTP
jgi:outer membrane protein, heavy metal efflux system